MNKREQNFVDTVWQYYESAGRHDLPWRHTTDPYRILVSEIMLQQTQVSRVLPKYSTFIKLFPNTKRLAEASLGDVLRAWQGLGYNRRAKFLRQAAEAVSSEHKGKWPRTFHELRSLPGIGTYTAGAVMNFAYNEPIPILETNIRTVYLHHFFKDQTGISDKPLQPIIERTLDLKNPREWHWALMDYGSYLKAAHGNINVRSKNYKKQSPFKDSNRYVRGMILRDLCKGPSTEAQLLKRHSAVKAVQLRAALAALLAEGMIVKKGAQMYQLS